LAVGTGQKLTRRSVFNQRQHSRRNALICSCSAAVGPVRFPAPRSRWRILRRNVSGEQPILLEMEVMAAHCVNFRRYGAISFPA
jgi:hypothetical protein